MAINPRIKQKAEDIRSKIFGSEVRESLASGIEAISEDVEAPIGRQGYVEEQFQDVLDETTGKDLISAPELIAARNGKSNLKTRLDDEHAQVTAQLQQMDVQLSKNTESLEFSNGELANNILNVVNSKTNVFTEPLISVTNTATDTKKHVAFPTMAIDGDKLLVMYRRGLTHISQGGTQDNGSIVQKISTDAGVTWTAEQVVYAEKPDVDPRDPNIFQISNTHLLMIMPVVGLNQNGTIKSVENEVYQSTDFGGTWSKIGNLPKKQNDTYYHIVRGSITRSANGKIIVPVWSAHLSTGKTTLPYTVESMTNGQTWSVGSSVGDRPATETSIEYDHYNRLWAVMRNDPTTGIYRQRNMLVSYSDDNGVTWSPSTELPLRGHAPHLLKNEKELLLTYRNTDKYAINKLDDRHSVNVVKLKNGAVSSRVYDIFNTTSGDSGYTWSVKNSQFIYTVYYVFAGTFGIIYIKKMPLTQVTELSVVAEPTIYKNYVGTVSYLERVKTIYGDAYIQGVGTPKASLTNALPETVKSIRKVDVSILNDPDVNFVYSVSGLGTTGFTVNIRNLSGNFSSSVQILYRVTYEDVAE